MTWNRETFSAEVLRIIEEDDDEVEIVDAIVTLCDKYQIDLSIVPKLLTEGLKKKLEEESIKLKRVKRGESNADTGRAKA